MNDNIFNETNNQYTNPNLTGNYQNSTNVINKNMTTEEDLIKNAEQGTIINNTVNLKKESIEELLKSDHVESKESLNLNDAKFTNNKFINTMNEELIKQEKTTSFMSFDDLNSKIIPTENKIINQYEIPNLQLGEEKNTNN